MKDILGTSRFATLAIGAATGALGSDLILNEVDTGTAKNGTVVVTLNNAASSDVRNLEIWTSTRSNFATSGTALAAIASDGLAKIAIESDTANNSKLFAKGIFNGTISDITVTSNGLSDLNQDMMVVINCPNVSKYLNIQYDSSGTGGIISATFIGHDLEEAPYAGARTAY